MRVSILLQVYSSHSLTADHLRLFEYAPNPKSAKLQI